jgi:Co/Zn/Cd efflux system component
LIGVGLAAAGLFLHQVVAWTTADGIASLLIGILLAVTALGLAGPLADLLIGQSGVVLTRVPVTHPVPRGR